MTLVLKTDFLQNVLFTQLQKADSFPVHLKRSGYPIQIIQVHAQCFVLMMQFTQYRGKGESDKAMVGSISDKYTWITCQFSAECCNDFESYGSV